MHDVFVTTAPNPKFLIFTFGIVPFAGTGDILAASPYIAGLVPTIATVALCWIAFGATLQDQDGSGARAAIVRKVGAVVLAGFAFCIASAAIALHGQHLKTAAAKG